MSKKKYILIGLAILLIGIIVFIKINFPYVNFTFIKDSLFPPPSKVDSKTQATIKIYTKKLTKEQIINLIHASSDQRVMVIGTTNPDGTPHAGVLKISENQENIDITGNPINLTIQNIKRNKRAVIQVYQKPQVDDRWFEHVGARIWVELIESNNPDLSTVSCSMKITAFRAI